MTGVSSADELRSVALVGDVALPIDGGRIQIGLSETGQVVLGMLTTPSDGTPSSSISCAVTPELARYIIAALEGSVARADAFAERPAVTN